MIILVSSVVLIGLSAWFWRQGEIIWHYLPLLVVAIYGLSYTLGSWSGRAEISLLLKLVEESRKK
jgi:hypothetical protein